eukprot:GHVO01001997.1.p1 GENE.GHVO01001997.1~~GHVO01001997.1.p1  ORF type:complete len:259 (+),score=31.74 GHVO01001997.1:113-889(+)
MNLHGKIVVIKRNGTDRPHFPLTMSSCLFGRSNDCDIRIQLPNVSKEHCRLDVSGTGEVSLVNLSNINPVCVNGDAVEDAVAVQHKDTITVIDRLFRFEFPPNSSLRVTPQKSPTRSPLKSIAPQVDSSAAASEDDLKKTPKTTVKKVLGSAVKPKTPKGRTPDAKSATPKGSSAKNATPKSSATKAKQPTPKVISSKAKSPKTPALKAKTPKTSTPKLKGQKPPTPKSTKAAKTPKARSGKNPKTASASLRSFQRSS